MTAALASSSVFQKALEVITLSDSKFKSSAQEFNSERQANKIEYNIYLFFMMFNIKIYRLTFNPSIIFLGTGYVPVAPAEFKPWLDPPSIP